jgi:hypothetical protein
VRAAAAAAVATKDSAPVRTESDGITYRPLRGVRGLRVASHDCPVLTLCQAVYPPTDFKATAKGAQPPADQLHLEHVYVLVAAEGGVFWRGP